VSSTQFRSSLSLKLYSSAKTQFTTELKTELGFLTEVNLNNPVLNWTYAMDSHRHFAKTLVFNTGLKPK